MSDSQTVIEGWAIIDMLEHNKLSGYLSTVHIGGSALFRVDIPEEGEMPAYTRFVGVSAIYSLTLVTEELARAALRAIRPEPVTVDIPRQLPERAEEDDRGWGEVDEEEPF